MGQIFDQWRAGKHMLGSDLPVKGMSQLSIPDKKSSAYLSYSKNQPWWLGLPFDHVFTLPLKEFRRSGRLCGREDC